MVDKSNEKREGEGILFYEFQGVADVFFYRVGGYAKRGGRFFVSLSFQFTKDEYFLFFGGQAIDGFVQEVVLVFYYCLVVGICFCYFAGDLCVGRQLARPPHRHAASPQPLPNNSTSPAADGLKI